jgi:hypothetical protein
VAGKGDNGVVEGKRADAEPIVVWDAVFLVDFFFFFSFFADGDSGGTLLLFVEDIWFVVEVTWFAAGGMVGVVVFIVVFHGNKVAFCCNKASSMAFNWSNRSLDNCISDDSESIGFVGVASISSMGVMTPETALLGVILLLVVIGIALGRAIGLVDEGSSILVTPIGRTEASRGGLEGAKGLEAGVDRLGEEAEVRGLGHRAACCEMAVCR